MIVLDLRLPDLDGYDVCRQLKTNPQTSAIPILMLSTRSKDTEKVIGLEVGAEDYITKPYNPIELLARIRVALRRVTKSPLSSSEKSVYTCGQLVVDVDSRQATVNKKVVKLTRKEFDLLVFFLSKPDKAHTRSNLMSAVWGVDYESMQGTVDSHIRTLRKKLGPVSESIETIPAVGYRWSSPVQ